MKSIAFSIALAAALSARAAFACGACVEDKIAATYDYAVVQRAASKGEVVVFCELEGTVSGKDLARAARRVSGIDARSVRIARNPAALSFALDAARRSPESAVEALQREAPGTRVSIIRLVASSPVATR
jgi:hypothetical protein